MNGVISEGHGRALLGLPSAVEQLVALEAVTRQGLNVRQTEELVRRMAEKPAPKKAAPSRNREWKDASQYEAQLRDALGTKVALKRGRKGGQIVISFFSDEEFSSIFERITQK
jgi:ParB family chromosome partitioning protein